VSQRLRIEVTELQYRRCVFPIRGSKRQQTPMHPSMTSANLSPVRVLTPDEPSPADSDDFHTTPRVVWPGNLAAQDAWMRCPRSIENLCVPHSVSASGRMPLERCASPADQPPNLALDAPGLDCLPIAPRSGPQPRIRLQSKSRSSLSRMASLKGKVDL
jgi:hypothetical protein